MSDALFSLTYTIIMSVAVYLLTKKYNKIKIYRNIYFLVMPLITIKYKFMGTFTS